MHVLAFSGVNWNRLPQCGIHTPKNLLQCTMCWLSINKFLLVVREEILHNCTLLTYEKRHFFFLLTRKINFREVQTLKFQFSSKMYTVSYTELSSVDQWKLRLPATEPIARLHLSNWLAFTHFWSKFDEIFCAGV